MGRQGIIMAICTKSSICLSVIKLMGQQNLKPLMNNIIWGAKRQILEWEGDRDGENKYCKQLELNVAKYMRQLWEGNWKILKSLHSNLFKIYHACWLDCSDVRDNPLSNRQQDSGTKVNRKIHFPPSSLGAGY